MPFRDRIEAATQLADALAEYGGLHPLVLGIPRGGVIMAAVIARKLQGDLDVILVRKLRDPYQDEVAIGSIDESGHVYLNHYGQRLRDHAYLDQEKGEQLTLLRDRRKQYTPVRPVIDPAGRRVIIVDDGLATGSTMIAALQSVRNRHPATLVAATAVAPPETLEAVEELADRVVCLEAPDDFMAVGQFFHDFTQVTDNEVIETLRQRPTTPD